MKHIRLIQPQRSCTQHQKAAPPAVDRGAASSYHHQPGPSASALHRPRRRHRQLLRTLLRLRFTPRWQGPRGGPGHDEAGGPGCLGPHDGDGGRDKSVGGCGGGAGRVCGVRAFVCVCGVDGWTVWTEVSSTHAIHNFNRYDTHHDFFDYRLYKNDPGTMHLIQNGRRNRMITVLWFVVWVESTRFGSVGVRGHPADCR